jgi:hypothetical protein
VAGEGLLAALDEQDAELALPDRQSHDVHGHGDGGVVPGVVAGQEARLVHAQSFSDQVLLGLSITQHESYSM